MKKIKRTWKGWLVVSSFKNDMFWDKEIAREFASGTSWEIIPVIIKEK